MGADIVPIVNDATPPEREQTPGRGRVHDDAYEPGYSGPDDPSAYASSGPPAYEPDEYGLGPVSGGFGGSVYGQRRIEPSPPPDHGKMIKGALAGLAAGLLVAGVGGFFIGRASVDDAPAVPQAPAAPPALAAIAAANRAEFGADLAPLAQPWLTDMSGCLSDRDPGGPHLGDGQQSHVLCRDGGMYLHFVAYSSADAKSADLAFRQQTALSSAAILPGAEQPGRKLGGVTGAPGTYVEYATRAGDAPALCGVWWSRDNTDAAVYVDVLCDSLGGSWTPLRAVWRRHS
ncbi:hypothetical protein [Mangrovihabitans endophyticus]|uniref:Uncharacterized protein n=1 Tax=Mangrovihabitans endophyticus TaxID=1751298 RepID=A0A8J3FSU6_9ACTN|nr:hypothetical protein [Mangrovihabitans endophyticus]GGL19552.1 hypothetical protein GCM10012284_62630 [Mangrovihabitans endophyticus]